MVLLTCKKMSLVQNGIVISELGKKTTIMQIKFISINYATFESTVIILMRVISFNQVYMKKKKKTKIMLSTFILNVLPVKW